MEVPIIAALVAAAGSFVLGFSFGYYFSKADLEGLNKELLDACELALEEISLESRYRGVTLKTGGTQAHYALDKIIRKTKETHNG